MKALINLTGDRQNWLAHEKKLALVIKHVLEMNTELNQAYIQFHRVPPLYASGVRYQEEPLNLLTMGGKPFENIEDFALIPAVIERGWGDCFPAYTRLLRENNEEVLVSDVKPGERIWGLNETCNVEAVVDKGMLPVTALRLSNGTTLSLTAGHYVYVAGEKERRLVTNLRVNDVLLSPLAKSGLLGHLARDWGPKSYDTPVRVLEIIDSFAMVPCFDIQTSDHKVYLPEHHVTVSNCDDLAPWRCAELRNAGEHAKIRIEWKTHPRTGQKVYHVLVRRQNGDIEDPSLKLGMPG